MRNSSEYAFELANHALLLTDNAMFFRSIEEAWRHAAKTLGAAPWKLDESIWTLGSKLCSGRKCGHCPVNDLRNKTKGITFRENTVIWEKAE